MIPVDQALLEYWVGTGHDAKFLSGNPTAIEEEAEMGDTAQHEPLGAAWKRKRYFDGKTCGMKDCTRAADGYICDKKPTKDGNNGRLWFGPACTKCVRTTHPTLMPLTLAQLAFQRNGASDLALILDVEVGDVLERLKAAGIDEKGQPLAGAQTVVPGAPAPTPPAQLPAEVVPADQAGAWLTVAVQSIVIPKSELERRHFDAQSVLGLIKSFNVVDQTTLDNASEMAKMVKTAYSEVEEARKEIVKPLYDKIKEVQAYFNPVKALLEEAEKELKLKISDGLKRAEQARQAALQAAHVAFGQGNQQALAQATQAAVASDVVVPAGVQMRKRICWQIVDATQIPAALWSPDEKKIQAAVDAGYRQIPGVNIWEEQTPAVYK